VPSILEARELTRIYRTPDSHLTVLKDVSFALEAGGSCAIVGPSGSGKTTLLALCAGLDTPTSGTIFLDGSDLNALDEDERARLRGEKTGFVFQSFQLLPTLTALENVMVPLELRGERQVRPKATDLLRKVGLGERLEHYPVQLSGGEQQRVALALAFLNKPRILFADEPTGNLDNDTSENVISLLFELNRSSGTALVLVTHDLDLAARAGRVIRLKSGHLIEDRHVESPLP